MEREEAERRRKPGKEKVEIVFFFARRRSQLSTFVISPSLYLFAHQGRRKIRAGQPFKQ